MSCGSFHPTGTTTAPRARKRVCSRAVVVGGAFYVGSCFACLDVADSRRILGSMKTIHAPRLHHQFASFFLRHPRGVQELKGGSFLITVSELSGQASTKISVMCAPLRTKPRNTVWHDAHANSAGFDACLSMRALRSNADSTNRTPANSR